MEIKEVVGKNDIKIWLDSYDVYTTIENDKVIKRVKLNTDILSDIRLKELNRIMKHDNFKLYSIDCLNGKISVSYKKIIK